MQIVRTDRGLDRANCRVRKTYDLIVTDYVRIRISVSIGSNERPTRFRLTVCEIRPFRSVVTDGPISIIRKNVVIKGLVEITS